MIAIYCIFLFLTQYKRKLVEEFTEIVIPHFGNGMLSTVVDSIFPMEEIQKAHRRMEANENIGKIIIQVREDENEVKSEL